MENDRIAPVNENIFNSSQQQESIYTKNLKVNKEKMNFWRFLMYSTKAEIYICEFHNLLYWVSLLEIFLYLIGLALFISSPKNFSEFWAFTTHIIRAILGLIVLKRLPNSSTVIEEVRESENSTLEDIQSKVLQTYKNLLSNNEGRIKPVLTAYFALTIIDIIIDNIIFFFLLHKWSKNEYSLENMIALVLIVTFFSINIIINFNYYLVCNGVYFSWAAGIKFSFPHEMRSPIFLVMFGRLNKLQSMIVKKAKNLYSRAADRFRRGRNENGDNKTRPQNNNVELNVNVHTDNLQNHNANNKNYTYDRPQLHIV